MTATRPKTQSDREKDLENAISPYEVRQHFSEGSGIGTGLQRMAQRHGLAPMESIDNKNHYYGHKDERYKTSTEDAKNKVHEGTSKINEAIYNHAGKYFDNEREKPEVKAEPKAETHEQDIPKGSNAGREAAKNLSRKLRNVTPKAPAHEAKPKAEETKPIFGVGESKLGGRAQQAVDKLNHVGTKKIAIRPKD